MFCILVMEHRDNLKSTLKMLACVNIDKAKGIILNNRLQQAGINKLCQWRLLPSFMMVLIYSACGNDQWHADDDVIQKKKFKLYDNSHLSSNSSKIIKKKPLSFKYITFIHWLVPAPCQLPKTVLFLFSLLAMNTLKLHY